MVNYIVAIYNGQRRSYKEPIGLICVKEHIEFLKKSPDHITHVTFIINKSGNDKEIIEYIELNIPHLPQDVKIYVRENIGFSYGGYSDVILKYHKDTEYSFIIEDDYIPSRLDFINYFMDELTDKYKIIMSLYKDNHASISNGLISNDIIGEYLNKNLDTFYYFKDDKYISGGRESQKSFLTNFDGYVTDIVKNNYTLFMGLDCKINIYGNKYGVELIRPNNIQSIKMVKNG